MIIDRRLPSPQSCIRRAGSATRTRRVPSRPDPGSATFRQPSGVSCTRERGSMMVLDGKPTGDAYDIHRGRWSP